MFQWRGRAAMPGAAVPSPALCPALRHGRSARLPDQPFAHPRLCLPCQLQDHLLAPWLITRQTWRPSRLQALRAPSWELEQQGPASKASTLQRAHPRGSPQAPGTGRAPASSPAGNCGFMGSRGQNHTTGAPWPCCLRCHRARPCRRQRAISSEWHREWHSEWHGAGREEQLIEEEMRQLPLVHSNLLIEESSRCKCCQLTCGEELFLPRWKGGQRGGQGGCEMECAPCPRTAEPCIPHSRALCPQMAVPCVPAGISLPRAGQVCPSLAGTVHLGTGARQPHGQQRAGTLCCGLQLWGSACQQGKPCPP